MVDIEKANAIVVDRFMEARPVATTMAKALEVVPGIHENMLLHAGPPVTWERMSGPTRGAMIGALIFEGKAKTAKECAHSNAQRSTHGEGSQDRVLARPHGGLFLRLSMIVAQQMQRTVHRQLTSFHKQALHTNADQDKADLRH